MKQRAFILEPENAEQLSSSIMQLYNNRTTAAELGASGQAYVNNYFRRDKIAESFWKELQAL